MDQAVKEPQHAAEAREGHDVAVAVITPSGVFPDDDDFRRVADTTIVEVVLKEAADKLKITNAKDWVVTVHDRPIEPHRTFKENGLSGIVEIEWHQKEGGGGA